MAAFPKPNDGKLGSIGRAVTVGGAPAGTMQDPKSETCAECGVPSSACPGHYKHEDAPPPAAPTSFMPTPFKIE